MAKEISRFIRDNLPYFQNYDQVILYYDNGQELSKSEQLIFHFKRELKKDFLKGIKRKELSIKY